ncbi:MAG: TetR/AcrR family transcriptional regulator [Acidimicrobiia bacterium]|nr:MAG: TetR/AcrR family transcriptional regulator [Acidimicrobiia bacterium]
MTPRRRARKGEGDLLRQEILDAAERLLLEKGSVEAVSIRALAKAVDVSPPSIYLHFPDKASVFFETCARGFTRFEASLRQAAQGGGDAIDRLRKMGRAYVEFGLSHPAEYRVLFGGGVAPPDDAGSDDPGVRAFTLVVGTIIEGMAAGTVRGDQDAMALAVAMWAAVHGAVLVLMQAESLSPVIQVEPAELIEAVIGVVVSGLAPPTAGAPGG